MLMLSPTLRPYFATIAVMNQGQTHISSGLDTPAKLAKKHITPSRVKSMALVSLLQLGQRLFDQQCWCWGRDIVSPQGNLLSQYGFVKLKPPPEQHGGSLYLWRDYNDDGSVRRLVGLWGFGIYYATPQHGALFLRRFEFQPRWVSNPLPINAMQVSPIWRPDQLDLFASQPDDGMTALFKQALTWLADYEAWVVQQRGHVYRHISLSQWLHRPVVPVRYIADVWRALGVRVNIRPIASNAPKTTFAQ